MTSVLPPVVANVEAFFARFRTETDRACGVLGAALLDALLSRLCEAAMVASPASTSLIARGALRSFYGRIEAALALGWIPGAAHHDLHVVREIRNDFAHHVDHELSFDTPSIAQRTIALRSTNAYLSGFDDFANNNPHMSRGIFTSLHAQFSRSRPRFELAVGFLAEMLDERSASAMHPVYTGPDLENLARAASSQARIKVSGTLTVG